LREGDVLVRYGGEEFLMLLPGASMDDAAEIAERIRLKVAETPLHVGDSTLQVTISQGVSGIPDIEASDPMDLIHRADEALYYAKESGRNRVVDGRKIVAGQNKASA
jgi:diguanylate cyclase (GGDEF)-like protein